MCMTLYTSDSDHVYLHELYSYPNRTIIGNGNLQEVVTIIRMHNILGRVQNAAAYCGLARTG